MTTNSHPFLLGQTADVESAEQAFSILQRSLELTQNTQESWNETWNTILGPDSGLWMTIIGTIAPIIAGICILYLALTEGKEAVEKQSWSEVVKMFIWPLIIVFSISANDGQLAANIAKGLRDISYSINAELLEAQVNEARLDEAIAKVIYTQVGKTEINRVLNACQDLSAEERQECLDNQTNNIDQIISEAEDASGGQTLQFLKDLGDAALNRTGVGTAIDIAQGDFLQERFVPIIQYTLMAIQWSFINILEAATVLTALSLPISLATSILPLQTKPTIAWLVAYISLFSAQFYYNVLVGLIALVLTESNAEGAADIGFMFFIAVFSPTLAILLANKGGMALFTTMQKQAKGLANTGVNLIGTIISKGATLAK